MDVRNEISFSQTKFDKDGHDSMKGFSVPVFLDDFFTIDRGGTVGILCKALFHLAAEVSVFFGSFLWRLLGGGGGGGFRIRLTFFSFLD